MYRNLSLITRGPYLASSSELVLSASQKRTFSSGVAEGDYDATLTEDTTNHTITVTEMDTGVVYVFHNFDTAVNEYERGKLKELTSRSILAETSLSGIQYSYNATGDAAGFVSTVTTPQGWQVDYTYHTSGDEAGRLEKIEVQDGSSNVIEKAEFTYDETADNLVTTPSTELGDTGDLVQVKVSTIDSAGSGWIVRHTQYRYGAHHQLKMVLESDAIQRIVAAVSGVTDPEDILEQDDANIEDYAEPLVYLLFDRPGH